MSPDNDNVSKQIASFFLRPDKFLRGDKTDYRRLVGYINHKCRTPLGNIQIPLELLLSDPEIQLRRENREKIEVAMRQISVIVDFLNQLTRQTELPYLQIRTAKLKRRP